MCQISCIVEFWLNSVVVRQDECYNFNLFFPFWFFEAYLMASLGVCNRIDSMK